MPHKPKPDAENLHIKRYVRKDGELIYIGGKWRFFTTGEVVESPRHLSPSHEAWVLAQLRYEAYLRWLSKQESKF